MRESCREWIEEKSDRCNAEAVFILWGKLFPKDAMGPRCWDHASKWLNGHTSQRDIDQTAVYDLRPVYEMIDRAEHAEFHMRQMRDLVNHFDTAVEDIEDGHKASPTVNGMKMVVDKVRARLPGEPA